MVRYLPLLWRGVVLEPADLSPQGVDLLLQRLDLAFLYLNRGDGHAYVCVQVDSIVLAVNARAGLYIFDDEAQVRRRRRRFALVAKTRQVRREELGAQPLEVARREILDVAFETPARNETTSVSIGTPRVIRVSVGTYHRQITLTYCVAV